MKKIKTPHNGFKRCSLLLILATFVSCSFVSLFPSTLYAQSTTCPLGQVFGADGTCKAIGAPSPPPATSASLNLDGAPISQQNDRTIAEAINKCLQKYNKGKNIRRIPGHVIVTGGGTKDNVKNEVSKEQLEDFDIFESGTDVEVAVGYELVPGDGTAQCKSLSFERGLGFIDMTVAQFRNQLYADQGNGKYKLKKGALDAIRLDVRSSLKTNLNAVGPKEKDRRVLIALGECVEISSSPKSTKNNVTRIPGTQASIISSPDEKIDLGDGKTYQYKKDRDKDTHIPMGYDLQADGSYSCQTLINLGKAALARSQENRDIFAGKLEKEEGTDSTSDEETNCEGKVGSLGWILCPFINGMSEANDWLFGSMLEPLLKNVPVGNSPEDAAYIAWQSFRVLGNVFLVACLLAIVFAQVRTPK